MSKKHSDVTFSKDSEAVEYIKKNSDELKRMTELRKEIESIEFELMTESEKKEHLEYLHKLKAKYADE